MAVRVRIDDTPRLRAFLRRLRPEVRRSVARESMERLANLTLENAVERQLIAGRSKDPKVAPPLPRKLTNRSLTLRNSIRVDDRNAPRSWSVGTPIFYGFLHEEKGVGRLRRRRPFLEPAARKILSTRARDVFLRALIRATRNEVAS